MLFIEAATHFLKGALFLDLLEFLLELLDFLRWGVLVAFKIHALGEVELGHEFSDALVPQALIDFVEEAEIFLELRHEAGEVAAFELGGALAVADHDGVGGAFQENLVERVVVFHILQATPFLEAIQGGLRDVDVIAFDQLLHMAEEKSEQQRANVAAVDISIRHQDDLSVAHLGRIEVVLGDARTQRGDHGADFFVRQHFVVAGLLDVENLSLQRQDSLEAAIAALFRGPACGLTFNEE